MPTIDPAERTVSELREDVRGIDDPDELRAMREAEAEGKDRKSAKEAIERQLNRIGGEGEAGSEESDEGDDTSEDGADEGNGENEAAEDENESGSEETPGTSIETTVVSTNQRLDAIGAGDEGEEKENGEGGTAETSDTDGATLEEGDSRGIGTGEGLDAIETAETAGEGAESEAKDGEGEGTSGRATSEDLKRRLSDFETDSASGEADNGEETNDTVGDESEEKDGSADGDESGEDKGTADVESTTDEEGGDGEGSEDGTRSDDADGSTDTTSETMSETETERTSDRDTESSDGSTAEGGNTATTDASSEGDASLIDVRNTVLNTAADLIGRRLDGISGIQRTDEGWSAIVNVIERRSVPDTQDILGRYEITLESSGEIVGYHRLNRYRRGDTTQEEWE